MRAQNTYLLALDGDIDFQPEAITRLVDKMKNNQNLGAACGRIIPTGSTSFMVILTIKSFYIFYFLSVCGFCKFDNDGA